MGNYVKLIVFQKAFKNANDVFRLSKNFPNEEKFLLTSQICRSSRAVCSCIAEGYRKRSYEKYFISKISDADMENSETALWLLFAKECEYINSETYDLLDSSFDEVGKILGHMLKYPEKFC